MAPGPDGPPVCWSIPGCPPQEHGVHSPSIGGCPFMRVTMLLADAAQVAEGKLNILGGGWDVCGPGPTPMAVAVILVVPPSQARRKHTWSVVLVDQNGEPALLPADGQKSAVAVQGEIQRIRDRKSLPPDEPVSLRFVINMAPLPLEPSSSYAWQLSIDNKTRKDWQISFRTRPATAQPS
jgi:hypothetical protein